MLKSLSPGAVVGEYRLERTLGGGGFGITYLAHDLKLDRQVAIKEYFPDRRVTRDPQGCVAPISDNAALLREFELGRETFLTEGRTLAKVDHPNTVRVITFLEDRNTAYLVMEYVEGLSLADYIEQQGVLNASQMLAILDPLSKGVKAVHDVGVLHCDIKPENILLRRDGSPVLIDFGAVRMITDSDHSLSATVVTPGYAAKELYSTSTQKGPYTDLYSLAAVAFSCLTGTAPPEATQRDAANFLPLSKEVRSKAPSHVIEAIEWGLAQDPAQRPSSIAAWRAVLLGDGKRARTTSRKASTALKLPSLSIQIHRPNLSVFPITIAAGAIVLLVGLILVGENVMDARPSQTAARPSLKPAETSVVDNSAAEKKDFLTAEEIGAPEAYAIYLRLHPNGSHRDLALARSSGLQ
ncbi:serine/threonine protein kinase [Rhizomicrobium palustre]|uniref:Serine/threonine protein kinase n=1 Tax=Rhizomicrobium palustre TaxID=189966 RepID=A0A846N3C9_9PROT|nr:serine/threonine-protein kinase [Rhizomicrobium palustre]NIK89617.1 serine/threonine protein kinase [Rhizomicrobium palustre]